MLTLSPDLPSNVVGVEADVKVTSEDYERLLVPAAEAARSASAEGKVRVLYVLHDDFPDYTAGAIWEDTKLGLGHFRSWERIAVASTDLFVRITAAATGCGNVNRGATARPRRGGVAHKARGALVAQGRRLRGSA